MNEICVLIVFKSLVINCLLSSVICSLPKCGNKFDAPVKLQFVECNRNGWTCQHSDGEMRVNFNCPQGYEERNPEVRWTFEGLPKAAKQLTLQNCNLILFIDEEVIYKLNRFKIRNVTELVVTPKRHETYLKAKKLNATRLYENRISILNIENVKYIRPLIFGTIWGEFEELSIRKCKIASLEWHAFYHVKTMLFNFVDNEVNSVKDGAFDLHANRVNIIGNTFHHLESGAFFDIYIGKDQNNIKKPDDDDNGIRPNDVNCKMNCQPIITFESNTIDSSDVGGLHIGKPNSYIVSTRTNLISNDISANSTNNSIAVVVPKYNVFVHHNRFNCINIKWLYDTFVNSEEENEKKKRLQEVKKKNFDKTYNFVLHYIIEHEHNVCYNLDCDNMSLGLYRDRFFIYGPKRNICDDTLEYDSTSLAIRITSTSFYVLSIGFVFFIF